MLTMILVKKVLQIHTQTDSSVYGVASQLKKLETIFEEEKNIFSSDYPPFVFFGLCLIVFGLIVRT